MKQLLSSLYCRDFISGVSLILANRSRAFAGATAGGAVDGIPEDEAKLYEERLKKVAFWFPYIRKVTPRPTKPARFCRTQGLRTSLPRKKPTGNRLPKKECQRRRDDESCRAGCCCQLS
jgi:hypothetical protein